MSNKTAYIIAALLLVFAFGLAVASMRNDSLTMDELAHLPAGYSYLTQKDMRLNPEHPPLIKDLAAFPLLFIKNINFPFATKTWQEDVNGQWDFGNNFLFKSGNPAEKMIFWGRIPIIFLLLLLGFYIFKFSRELFGNKAGLLALFLFSFSPTFLAHGRLVTTDVGAAAGAFIATYYFIKALQNSSRKNIIFAGTAFGIAELLKFSLILLIPTFVLLAAIWWLIKSGKLLATLKALISTFVIGYLLVWPVYLFHTWSYPPEKQRQDTKFILESSGEKSLAAKILVFSADKPVLRPYAQYGLGLLMVLKRASGGNTTYFMGEVSNRGWKTYFPAVYLIKETLTFHILTFFAILYGAWALRKKLSLKNILPRMAGLTKNHFPEIAMLVFIVIYWAFSLKSNLNIGVRHLLPVFPFTMVLVSAIAIRWIKEPFLRAKYIILFFLIVWQAVSILKVFPSFLAYFNELAGGPSGGYRYTVDSNLDWGQDLKRLDQWLDRNNIDKIYVDYFGGSDPNYYLKQKYVPWHGTNPKSEFPKNNYLAVSASFLQSGRGTPALGFDQSYGFYDWLNEFEPITTIDHSIFVYYIN